MFLLLSARLAAAQLDLGGSGPLPTGVQLLGSAQPQVGGASGMAGDRFLRLTEAAAGQRGLLVLPALDPAAPDRVTVEAWVRVAAGPNDRPGEGFSLSYAHPTDPALAGTGFASSADGAVPDAPEEGTRSGLAVSFDATDDGTAQPRGISVRSEGRVIAHYPLPTLNGTAIDPDSLQTGPNLADARWVPLRVELLPASGVWRVAVWWKGRELTPTGGLPTSLAPFPGRLLVAARTGPGAQQTDLDALRVRTTESSRVITRATAGNGFWNEAGAWQPAVVPNNLQDTTNRFAAVWSGVPRVLDVTNTVMVQRLEAPAGGLLRGPGDGSLFVTDHTRWGLWNVDGLYLQLAGSVHFTPEAAGAGQREIRDSTVMIVGDAFLPAGPLTLRDQASLNILPEARVTLRDDTVLRSGIADPPDGTLSNFGLLEKADGPGTNRLGLRVYNWGTLRVVRGTLNLGRDFTQSGGTIALWEGATLRGEATSLDLANGRLTGSGTVASPVSFNGLLEPGGTNGVGTLAFPSGLALASQAITRVEVGTRLEDGRRVPTVDRLVGTNLVLRGRLEIRLLGGSAEVLQPTHVLTVVNAAGAVVGFDEVQDGVRLPTADGAGSFLVRVRSGAATRLELTGFEPAPPTPVREAGLPGYLVYGRAPGTGDPGGSIWLARADGSLDLRLTTGQRPRLSSDGRTLVFFRDGPNGPAATGRGDLWRRDLATGAEERLVSNTDFILGADFGNAPGELVLDSTCSIYSFRPASGFTSLVEGDCFDDAPVVRRLDGALAFHNTDRRQLGLRLPAGDVVRLPAAPIAGLVPLWPAWRPDGAVVGFTSADDTARFLVIPATSGANPTDLTALVTAATGFRFAATVPGIPAAPGWSLDGRHLLAPVTVAGLPGIYALDGSGTDLFRLPMARNAPAVFVGGLIPDTTPLALTASIAVEIPAGTSYFAPPLLVGDGTLDEVLGQLADGSVVLKPALPEDVFSIRVGGRWNPNLPVAVGEGVMLINSGRTTNLTLTGRVVFPSGTVRPVGDTLRAGPRLPQRSTLEQILGYSVPNGTRVTRYRNNQVSQFELEDGQWTVLIGAGNPLPASAPVADPGEAFDIELGGPVRLAGPFDRRVPLGEPARLGVTVLGAGTVRYQWYREGFPNPLPNATGPALDFPVVRAADLGRYRVEVTDDNGTELSPWARLEGSGPLTILGPVEGPSGPVALGARATLRIVAVGDPTLSYQWLRNGRPIPGADSDTLEIDSFAPAEAGLYSVVVRDASGSRTSQPRVLVPQVPLLPATDPFDARANNVWQNALTTESRLGRVDLAGATREAREPEHGSGPSAGSLWLSFLPVRPGIATLDTAGSAFDTALAVYRAADPANPGLADLVRVAADDDPEFGVNTARVEFNVEAGTRYFVALSGSPGPGSSLVLRWSLEGTTQRLPTLAAQPPSLASENGTPAVLAVDPVEIPGVSQAIQWFRDGRPIPGGVGRSLELGAVDLNAVGIYRAEIRASYAGGQARVTRSEPAEIQLFQRSNGSDRSLLARDKLTQIRADLAKAARPAAPAGAQPAGLSRGVSGSQVFTTLGESRDPDEPVHCGVAGGASKWYPLVADADGIITVDTAGTGFDTVLAVYYDTGAGTGLYDGLVEVACNNDAAPGTLTSSVTFCARSGAIYLVAVDGVEGVQGIVRLNYSMADRPPGVACPAPAIPCPMRVAERVVPAGGEIRLSATVDGTEPLKITWLHNGVALPNASGRELILTKVDAAMAGGYAIRASSPEGEVEREVARVTVVTGPQPVLGYEEGCDGSLQFTVAGSPNTAYALEATTNLVTWTRLFTGSSTNGLLVLPVMSPSQTAGRIYRAVQP